MRLREERILLRLVREPFEAEMKRGRKNQWCVFVVYGVWNNHENTYKHHYTRHVQREEGNLMRAESKIER